MPSLIALTDLGDAETLALHVLVLVETSGLDDAEGHDFRGAARGAGGHALALEIGHGVDAGAFDGHDMHAVGVDDQERLQRNLAALELVFTLVSIQRCVSHGEAKLALSRADELEVVHGAAGDFGRRLHARQVLREHVGDRAAERIVHAAGAAGSDRHRLLLRVGAQAQPDRQHKRRVPR